MFIGKICIGENYRYKIADIIAIKKPTSVGKRYYNSSKDEIGGLSLPMDFLRGIHVGYLRSYPNVRRVPLSNFARQDILPI